MNPPATRSDWQATPYDGPCRTLPCRDAFTRDEFERIRAGLVPDSMDDKWFVFFEEPHLYFHRSGTGLFVYRLTFAATSTGARIAEALMTTEVPSENVEYDARLVLWVLRELILGQDVEFPRMPSL